MREEKPGELIPLIPDHRFARVWLPDQLLLEGDVEIRPCAPCRKRLMVSASDLGTIVSCPVCGRAMRALAAAGPFAGDELESGPRLSVTPPIALETTSRTIEAPLLAPVVPFRHADPIDDRSPMVNAVARLMWFGGVYLVAVALGWLGLHWIDNPGRDWDELRLSIASAVRCVLAAGLLSSSSLVASRRRGGWGFALGISALILAAAGYRLFERASASDGYRAQFDFGFILEMPILLIAIFSATILSTPRYFAEFAVRGPDQTGTM